MALNASGPISIAGTTAGQSIQIELNGNGTTQMSLNDAAVRALAGVPSGAITMPTNFYGKANEFAFTISTNTTNGNLRTLAVNAGWNQTSKVVATIGSGVVMSANSTGTPGLTINGSFPNGVQLNNTGFIIGMGGNGGRGGNSFVGPIAGAAGAGGGLALSVSVAVTVNNTGTIGGGGGGGGGGGPTNEGDGPDYYSGGGGGGGRTGSTNSSGGAANNAGSSGGGAGGGGSGTFSAAGGGGTGAGGGIGGNGGSGGGFGSSGAAGQSGGFGGGGGGAAGGAITGNSNITYIATGTRLGGIS
jgi:hypothetical protein